MVDDMIPAHISGRRLTVPTLIPPRENKKSAGYNLRRSYASFFY
jgi:hypothetical protein